MRKIIFSCIVVLLAASLFCYVHKCYNGNINVISDTTWMVRVDTIRDTITTTITHWEDKVVERRVIDTLIIDTPTILQREQIHYQDSLKLEGGVAQIDAFVSGVEPSLDSIKIEANLEHYTTTNTITIKEREKIKKHWNWGPSVGVGYGLINRKPDVFVGVGVEYSF